MNETKSVTLTLHQWQIVFATVQHAPYRDVHEIIDTMKAQLEAPPVTQPEGCPA